jgi:hypothetical protein
MLLLQPQRLNGILNAAREDTARRLKEGQKAAFQQALRDNLVRGGSFEDFRRLFPSSLVEVYDAVFLELPGWEPLYQVLKRTAHERQVRFESLAAQAVPLEKHYVFQFVAGRLTGIFQEMADYYTGSAERLQEPDATFALLDHLRGAEDAQAIVQSGTWEAHFQVQSQEIKDLLARAEGLLESNYAKIRHKREVNAALLAYMAANALNFRKTYLFVHLSPRHRENLLAHFLHRKDLLQLKGQLLSAAKLLQDDGAWLEDPLQVLLARLDEPAVLERLRSAFRHDLVSEEEPVPLTPDFLKKALVFLHHRGERKFDLGDPALGPLLEDPLFRETLQADLLGRYERFVRDQILPRLADSPHPVHQVRRILHGSEEEEGLLPETLRILRDEYVNGMDGEDVIRSPFEAYEGEVLRSLEGGIAALRQNFNALPPDTILEEGLRLLSGIGDRLLFWADFRNVLEEFGTSFLHFQRIPSRLVSFYTQLVAEYFSRRLEETVWHDLPPLADPQTLLFAALWEAREKGKLLELDAFFGAEPSFPAFEERLFELRLSTPYRDFYSFCREAFRESGGLPLLREVMTLLFREDKDHSLSQRILQEMSFLPDMGPEGLLGLLLHEEFFRSSFRDLKDRLWAIGDQIPPRFRAVLAQRGLLEAAPDLVLSPSERFFLQILETLGLERPKARFLEHLRALAHPSASAPGGSRWEAMFIPHRHYLIQIEPVGTGMQISMNVSGHTEGPHPFAGRVLKRRHFDPEAVDLPEALDSFHTLIAFLRDLESCVFRARLVAPKPGKILRMRRRNIESVITFDYEGGRPLLQPEIQARRPGERMAKIWRSFLIGRGPKGESDEDMRTVLELLAPHFLGS